MFKNQIFNNFHLIKDFIVEYRDAWKRIEISPKALFIILDQAWANTSNLTKKPI